MNNKKAKERWMKIQDNNKKCCANCSQLCKYSSGDYICYFLTSKKEVKNSGVIIHADELSMVRGKCFDKYNGLNLK